MMLTTKIPGTDLEASQLCLGTGDFGAGVDHDTALQMLDLFIERGGDFIDTAKIYNDWIPGEKSRSEKLIGVWMKSRNNRQNVILATKGAHPDMDSMHIPRLSPEEIVSDLDSSLQHLQTDVIDLYWLHRDDVTRPVAEIMETLQEQVQAGKIRYFGFSNWGIRRLQQAGEYARRVQVQSFCAVQNLWSLAQVNKDGFGDKTIAFMTDELWQFHNESQIAAIPYSSQANGVFHKLATGGVEKLPSNLVSWYWNEVTEERQLKLEALRKESGMTITQLVLGYLTSQPFPTFPIIGPKSIDQLKDCLTASNIILTREQVNYLR